MPKFRSLDEFRRRMNGLKRRILQSDAVAAYIRDVARSFGRAAGNQEQDERMTTYMKQAYGESTGTLERTYRYITDPVIRKAANSIGVGVFSDQKYPPDRRFGRLTAVKVADVVRKLISGSVDVVQPDELEAMREEWEDRFGRKFPFFKNLKFAIVVTPARPFMRDVIQFSKIRAVKLSENIASQVFPKIFPIREKITIKV